MTIRYYVVPTVDSGGLEVPKYIDDLGVDWGMMDYGNLINIALVAADVDTAQHASIAANIDVVFFPVNIDNPVSLADVTRIGNGLELADIPGQWITTSTTYREVLRWVGGLFQFANRHYGENNTSVIPEGSTLDASWGSLTAGFRTEIEATADTLNYSYSAISISTTLREVLDDFANQWGAHPLDLGIVVL